jgi:hypothetical protein
MFGGQCKNNKIWCCLEHLDLLLQQSDLSFLHRPTHKSFLGFFWHGISTHVHNHLTENSGYFILFSIFSNSFYEPTAFELGSTKTMFSTTL